LYRLASTKGKMMAILLNNAKIITPTAVLEKGWLLVQGKLIQAIGSGTAPNFEGVETLDCNGLTLLPGFIDVHVHGGVGYEVMDSSPDAIRAMAQFYARHGVTGYLATTWTESRQKIMAALELIVELQGAQPGGATILGVHLEGPYFDEARRGAQRGEHIRRAEREEALEFLDTGIIRLLSVAPEYRENWWLIDECRHRGITVSAAHSSATHDQMNVGIDLGITHATHTFNAMTSVHHREPGGAGAILTRHEVYCELIADNIHVHPTVMQILYRCKGADRVVLITDAVRVAGMPDGKYAIDGDRMVIVKEGRVQLPDGTLAGSTLTMDKSLRNFMNATGEPIEKIWQTSSLNAARSLHIANAKGSLEVGKDADIVLVDADINVYLTVAEGQIVYRKDSVSA
jgi:N-acetylglucosamine-6-phosphate deacetylase